VVTGEVNQGKYPTGYWGSLGGVGKKATTINWSWNAMDRDKVRYAYYIFKPTGGPPAFKFRRRSHRSRGWARMDRCFCRRRLQFAVAPAIMAPGRTVQTSSNLYLGSLNGEHFLRVPNDTSN